MLLFIYNYNVCKFNGFKEIDNIFPKPANLSLHDFLQNKITRQLSDSMEENYAKTPVVILTILFNNYS